MNILYPIDTKASVKISAIICNKNFCKDVMKLSPVYQTSKCEAFHSLVNNFAPKSVAFSFHGMLSRSVQSIFKYNLEPRQPHLMCVCTRAIT